MNRLFMSKIRYYFRRIYFISGSLFSDYKENCNDKNLQENKINFLSLVQAMIDANPLVSFYSYIDMIRIIKLKKNRLYANTTPVYLMNKCKKKTVNTLKHKGIPSVAELGNRNFK